MRQLYFARLDAYQAGKLVELLGDISYSNPYDEYFGMHLAYDIIEQFAADMNCEDFALWHTFARNVVDD